MIELRRIVNEQCQYRHSYHYSKNASLPPLDRIDRSEALKEVSLVEEVREYPEAETQQCHQAVKHQSNYNDNQDKDEEVVRDEPSCIL